VVGFTVEKVNTHTTLQQRFGRVVRRRREAAGLSQEALAGAATLHRTYISLLERGLRMPSIEVVRKLAVALDTTMSSLMADLEASEPKRPAAPKTKKG
jgi:transcriptional regulator with XRE-family HTH domain